MPPNGTTGGVFIHKNLKGGDSRQPASREAGFFYFTTKAFLSYSNSKIRIPEKSGGRSIPGISHPVRERRIMNSITKRWRFQYAETIFVRI